MCERIKGFQNYDKRFLYYFVITFKIIKVFMGFFTGLSNVFYRIAHFCLIFLQSGGPNPPPFCARSLSDWLLGDQLTAQD